MNSEYKSPPSLPDPGPFGDYPIGTIVAFAGNLNQGQLKAQGWLYCNGDTATRSGDTANLFAVIGTAHGKGDGVSTFDLPDLRGYFARGADNGAQVDPDATTRHPSQKGGNSGPKVGSAQGFATAKPQSIAETYELGAHTHLVSNVPTECSSYPVAGSYQAIFNPNTGTDAPESGTAGAHCHTVADGGDAETVPTNVSVYYCIKFKDV